MAYWKTRAIDPQSTKRMIVLGDGVNKSTNIYNIKDSEAIDSRNVSSVEYPALSTRLGVANSFDTTSTPIATPNGAGNRNGDTFHVVDGTVWKYWNGASFTNVATGLTDATAKIVELNNATKRYTILFNGTDKKAWDGTTVTDLTEAPASKLITIDDYRLYVLAGSVLSCSAVYDPTDFTTLEDSATIPIVDMVGTGTALAAFQDAVIAWSDKTMHILLGNEWDDFQFSNALQFGCVSDRSVVENNGRLYFMDYDRYMMFTGGFPVEISQKVREYLEDINYTYKAKICAGSQGRYLYLSIPYGGSATNNNLTLEYDAETSNWYLIDKGYLNFVNIGEDLYGVKTNGVIEKMNTGTDDAGTAISWYHNTGMLKRGGLHPNITLSDIYMEIYLPSNSTLDVGYCESTDDSDFTTIESISSEADERKVRIQVPTFILQNSERYRLKFSGTGPCTIHFVELHEATQR